MTDNLKAFLKRASEDKKLKDRLNALQAPGQDKDAVTDAVIGLAKENGFALTRADFAEESRELSPDELQNVAGGSYCFCAAAGGGSASGHERACACVVGGGGEIYDDANESWTPRCVCVACGSGGDIV